MLSLIVSVALLLIVVLIFIFLIIGFYTEFLAAPFVPTSNKDIDEILKKANFKKGKTLIELGSGDGRVVRRAVRKYGVFGIGIEIHPFLVFYSKLVSKITKIPVEYRQEDFFKVNLSQADYIFLFLYPKAIKKLVNSSFKSCKKGTLIISHGFSIPGWEKEMVDTQERNSFNTYFYKV